MVQLIKCKTCGETVDKTIPKCPRCGDSFPGLHIQCPKCGAQQIEIAQKGLTLIKTAMKYLIAYFIGGFEDIKKGKTITLSCPICKHRWNPSLDELREKSV